MREGTQHGLQPDHRMFPLSVNTLCSLSLPPAPLPAPDPTLPDPTGSRAEPAEDTQCSRICPHTPIPKPTHFSSALCPEPSPKPPPSACLCPEPIAQSLRFEAQFSVRNPAQNKPTQQCSAPRQMVVLLSSRTEQSVRNPRNHLTYSITRACVQSACLACTLMASVLTGSSVLTPDVSITDLFGYLLLLVGASQWGFFSFLVFWRH